LGASRTPYLLINILYDEIERIKYREAKEYVPTNDGKGKMKLPPLLLTSAVIVGDEQSVKLIDPEKRVKHTIESIEKWLTIAPALDIVICDGSGYDYTMSLGKRFPKKRIETLSFSIKGDLIKKYGKGYGEGEIIRYAIRTSKILSNSPYFAKCTAKLWVNNFNLCVKQWNGDLLCYGKFQNVFSIRETVFKEIDTRFYIASVKFYTEHLLNLHLGITEKSPDGIEVMFKNFIETSGAKNILFSLPPLIGGMGGGSGVYYNTSMLKYYKECARTMLLRRANKWGSLFV
jgi:hypothetical protein